MSSFLLSAEVFVYAALAFYVLGLLFRDELWLRGLLLIGTIFYIVYYYTATDAPLWDAIVTSTILGLVNAVMIVVVIWERTTFAMGGDTAVLYSFFKNLSPGQFRRIMKRGQLVVVDEAQTLCVEGAALDKFYFVYEGQSVIAKRGVSSDVPVGHFIGEVAFLRGVPATATVTVQPGSRYVVWAHDDLRKLMKKSPNLSNALIALLNLDLASKVASSQPVGQ